MSKWLNLDIRENAEGFLELYDPETGRTLHFVQHLQVEQPADGVRIVTVEILVDPRTRKKQEGRE